MHHGQKIQGICYGPKMDQAIVAKGFKSFVKISKKLKYSLILVSHKTEFPASGLQFNLRIAANNWIFKNLPCTFDKIFLKIKFSLKIKRIKSLNPNFLIDDLPIVLEEFSKRINLVDTKKIIKLSSSLEIQNIQKWNENLKII